jgi:hypothetical protein
VPQLRGRDLDGPRASIQEDRMPDRRSAVLVAMALVFAAATPAAAQSATATYVVLGGAGAVARAVVFVGAAAIVPQCPAIVVNGTSQTMSVRGHPNADFPILVCEFALPASATSASVAGQALPLPPAELKSIAVFGDTGCRLKATKPKKAPATQVTRDTDEPEESGKFQDCNNLADWPFAPMSTTIANAKPDLVVHVGDYLYRESACPSGDQGCEGSPHGDNWTTWAADFFTPAAPLLKAAPWIVTRGNHEICSRAGLGYALLLDPSPASGNTPPACVEMIGQYTVSVGGHAFIMLDSSDAADECPKSGCDSKPYKEQFAAMKPAKGTWLVTHRPIWGFTNSKDKKTGKRKLGIRNMTLQAAVKDWNNAPPAGIDLVLSGHIHLWEALSFADKRSPQFVLGSGSTELAHKITEKLQGQKIDHTTIAAAKTDHHFGYTMFAPSKHGGHWDATFYDTSGNAKIACKVEPTKATCR